MTRLDTNRILNKLIGNDKLNVRQDSNAIINAIYDSENTAIKVNIEGGVGGGIEGTEYLYVAGSGSSTENATELQAAYDTATGMTPNESALATNNRVRILVGPGKYEFPNSSAFEMDTQYIDVVSLTGNRDVFTYTVSADDNLTTRENIIVSASDVFVKGIDASTTVWIEYGGIPSEHSGAFNITDDLPDLVCENCKGGRHSFGYEAEASGTFENCTGGERSFGYEDDASGTFTDCTADYKSFGYDGEASGTFINCTGGSHLFGYDGYASGTFTDCTAGNYSFGSSGYATGTFKDCTGGKGSFGSYGTASGTFTNCTAGGDESFGSGTGATASGTFTNCTASDSSFGWRGTASGTFTNCTASYNSFGYEDDASGTFTNCTGGERSFGHDATASGTFTNCTAGGDSFGHDGTLTGQLYYCRLTDGTFQEPTGDGLIRASIDGDDVFQATIDPV